MKNSVLERPSLSESSLEAKSVREQLRALETTLRALSFDVSGVSGEAHGRVERARLNIKGAVDELLCTDGTQMPF